ncbi:hypothetical protein AAIP73_002741 [Yersinia ruckeri]|uniref:hypothetical protein n=1 Tax=Yersinia ruckeri TaxID=29486 RepID=UPI002238559F|nr:hypothetical protein [Yersinia ruckeri]EKN4700044.1 hypothetical protein [Yersinia ruckeri]ELM3741008.1 hypothetical protein [Yersinia ruckeri]ELM3747770.1 hypothetical protein [Yersinia ruckeri]MCW6632918.1 hypothetical protein [Yersinia ruckeri]MCW6636910.1 hypothetical protein [Yersinia ruckeri]
MGTYIKTCAEIKTANGWKPVSYGVFPPVPWHDMDEYEKPKFSEPFRFQNYGMFGLFAGVRNYSHSQVLAESHKLPDDISEEALLHLVPEILQVDNYGWGWVEPLLPATVSERISRSDADSYGYSWLSASELTEFDYDQTFTNQRTKPPETVTYRDFLGERYFLHLDTLKALSVNDEVRVLFCFQG